MLKAIARYRELVLKAARYDASTGVYRYKGRITEAAILRLAGVKSRSTLFPDYHKNLRQEIKDAVTDLKLQAGKIPKARTNTAASAPSDAPREALEQTIAAQHFRILELEAAAAEGRLETSANSPFDRRRRQPPSRR